MLQRTETVSSEIFARVLFSRNFASAKFRDNKTPLELALSPCRLLNPVRVTHAPVVNI